MSDAKCQILKDGGSLQMESGNFLFNIARGFTFIELLISIAVAGVILTVVVSGLVSFRHSAEMNQAVDGVVAQLREARRRTIESKNASQWGVHVVSTSTTLFSGPAYDVSGADNEVFTLPSTVTISGFSNIVFRRISGDTDNAGTLMLTQSANTKVINIRSSGLAEIQ